MAAAARRRPDVDERGHAGPPQQPGHLLGRGGPVPERQQHLILLSCAAGQGWREPGRTGRLAAVTTYTGFFSGTATVAGALVGLLFVARGLGLTSSIGLAVRLWRA